MDEKKTRIVVVMVLVGVLLTTSAVAWGQASETRGRAVRQLEERPRRLVRPPVEVQVERDVVPPEQIEELSRRRDELTERARLRQMELREIQEARAARERELRGELSDIQAELAGVEADLMHLQQRQAEARRRALARAEDRSAAMSEQLRDLSNAADQMRGMLSRLRETDAEQGQMLRDSLMQTRRQLRQLEMAPPLPMEEPPVRLRRRRIEIDIEPSPEPPQVRGELRDVLSELREARELFEATQAQPEPPRANAELNARIDQLSLEVGRLYERLPAEKTCTAEKTCVAVPCTVRRPGTIGSAGHYNWQPNYGLYYLY